MKTYRNFIANEWRDAVDGEHIDVRNPSTGQVLAKLARGRREDVDLAVAAARQALSGEWGRLTATERGRILSRIATGVLENIDRLTGIEARDVGKALTQARADVVALARYLEFYGASADKVHGDTIPYQNGFTVLTIYEPHGVTGHIIPWNYPMPVSYTHLPADACRNAGNTSRRTPCRPARGTPHPRCRADRRSR